MLYFPLSEMTNHYNRKRKGQRVIYHKEGIIFANSKILCRLKHLLYSFKVVHYKYELRNIPVIILDINNTKLFRIKWVDYINIYNRC